MAGINWDQVIKIKVGEGFIGGRELNYIAQFLELPNRKFTPCTVSIEGSLREADEVAIGREIRLQRDAFRLRIGPFRLRLGSDLREFEARSSESLAAIVRAYWSIAESFSATYPLGGSTIDAELVFRKAGDSDLVELRGSTPLFEACIAHARELGERFGIPISLES